MKVLYDYQIFDAQRVGGISRYFAMLATGNDQSILGLRYTSNLYLLHADFEGIEGWPKKDIVEKLLGAARFPGASRLGGVYRRLAKREETGNRQQSLQRLSEAAFDVFHPTYYDPYFLDALGDKPFVLTVHDMIHELYPELYGLDDQVRSWKRQLISKAAAIIAVSENTKKDLQAVYGVENSRISVIGHGSELKKTGKRQILVEGSYILFTGARGGYKNFYFALEAIAPLLLQPVGPSLVCIGSAFSGEERKLFIELGVIDRVIHIGADESDIYDLYAGALFLLFPSYYEGFGMPILEAFEAGCPVLLADSSCFPEIAGDAGLYFPPKDCASLLAAATELTRSPSLRTELADKGRERGKAFSWKRCRDLTRECYRGVV